MTGKRITLFLLIMTLGLSMALGQEKRIKIRKEIRTADSVSVTVDDDGQRKVIKKIIHSGDGDHSEDEEYIKVYHHGEDLDMGEMNIEVIMDHDFHDQDSTKKVIVMQKAHHAPPLSKIVVLKSGFFRRDTTVIYYEPYARKIVKVIENGKVVPKSKFHKYRDQMEGAMDLSALEDLEPMLEELELMVELPDFPDSLKLVELDSMLVELKFLQSDLANIHREKLTGVRNFISLDVMTEEILAELEKGGQETPEKIHELKYHDGKLYINGEELSGELGKKVTAIFLKHTGHEPGEQETIHINFD